MPADYQPLAMDVSAMDDPLPIRVEPGYGGEPLGDQSVIHSATEGKLFCVRTYKNSLR
jgi:hypothetical protein